VEKVQLEQYLSTGKLPDVNDLPYKMYAVVKKGIVQGYVWETESYPKTKDTEFVLMTFENSPAYTQGTYKNGIFYP
jgi:hypothetical protein